MPDLIDKVLETYAKVAENGYTAKSGFNFKRYAVSNLRGGVGKSTLSFNLAFEMSRHASVLVADLCPQRNLTETIMRGEATDVTILKALRPKILGSAFGDEIDDISYRISATCESFKGNKGAYFVPGDSQMFAFPSTLYQQLSLAWAEQNQRAVQKLLLSLRETLNEEAKDKKCELILMDTSPFYAGGTHLAWCAAEALIIPVRVDEHSIESLDLTLDMLSNKANDFAIWNERAGNLKAPKVAAVVMTMAGSKSQKTYTPDSASRMYIERALKTAQKYKSLFHHEDVSDAFVVCDDFVSAGRISGAKSIPISRLRIGSFHTVENRRLQVNDSAGRYQRELQFLASAI